MHQYKIADSDVVLHEASAADSEEPIPRANEFRRHPAR
jgi:hypothetical protein